MIITALYMKRIIIMISALLLIFGSVFATITIDNTNGISNDYAVFDGSSYIEMGTDIFSNRFGVDGSFCMGFWYNPNNNSVDTENLFSVTPTGNGLLSMTTEQYIFTTDLISETGTGTFYYDYETSHIIDDWVFVVMSFDGTKDKVYLYIDGVENTTDYYDMSDLGVLGNMTMGAVWSSKNSVYESFYTGYIDDVFMMNEYLDSSEVGNLYNNIKNNGLFMYDLYNTSNFIYFNDFENRSISGEPTIENGMFTNLLEDTGNGISNFFMALFEPLMYFLLVIGVIGGLTIFFKGISSRFNK